RAPLWPSPSALLLPFALCLLPWMVFAQDPAAPLPSFDDWLGGIRREALSRGISQATVDAAFADVHAPEPVIVSRDRTQPEQTQSLDAYLVDRLKPKVLAKAREMAAAHR